MRTQSTGWRTLAVLTAAAAIVLLAAGCQQSPQKAPKDEAGKSAAAAATAQIPQPMLDALHGKSPEGGAPATQPAQAMPTQAMPASMPGGAAMPGMGAGMRVGKVPSEIVVPDEIKKGWKAVVVAVAEAGGKSKDYRVDINGQLAIPGSGLTLKVESFLPDFKMTAQGITSLSNEPKNPAARVEVIEGGKTIFKGWLFKLFPEAHPFQHPKYRLTLKDWVAA